MERDIVMRERWDTRYDFNGRKRKKKQPKGEVFKKMKKPAFKPLKMEYKNYRETEHYASNESTSNIPHATARTESQKYTGTLIKGISTLHKSNAVPVISQEEAVDIANMRRN